MNYKYAIDHKGALHAHAMCRFVRIGVLDYFLAFLDIYHAIWQHAATLNFHLPYEVQFQSYYSPKRGIHFIRFVQLWGRLFGMCILWENTNVLETKEWGYIENPSYPPPPGILLCFDLGHFLLGGISKKERLRALDRYFAVYGAQIRHMHLHINDFIHDQHIYEEEVVKKFLGKQRFETLVEGRSYIFEE